MFKCKRCNSEFRDGVQCSVCLNRYDFPCAGITESGYRKLGERKSTWRCSACKNSSPAPARSSEMEGILQELKYLSEQISTMPALVQSVKKIQEELSELKSIKAEFSDLKYSVESVHHSVASLSSRLDSLGQEVQSLQTAKEEILSLQNRVAQLEKRANEDEQRSRLNNVEIKGVPFTASENLYTYINKISEIINYKVAKDQINYIMRVPTRGDKTTKNIIVSLHNRYIKEDFVAAARTCKPFTTANLGLTGDKRIFVNDHLTLYHKSLLNKTKALSKEQNFAFTWVKGCKIFIRKNATSPVINIKSDADLMKLKKSSN